MYYCAKHKTNEPPAPIQRKSRYSVYNRVECHPRSLYNVNRMRNRRYSRGEVIELSGSIKETNEEEVVWLRREGLDGSDAETKITNTSPPIRNGNNVEHKSLPPNNRMVGSESFQRLEPYLQDGDIGEVPNINRLHSALSDSANICARQRALRARKQVVAEWQRIAIVIDRILFWVYFLGTICSYLVILFVIPRQNYAKWTDATPTVTPASGGLG